ncbi:energy transducer TonB [Marinoscillum pacificum]|uniref:energy transducer TonB n=1 Tax=Marinoscillum pacificum TaxID=392723 RepID=UPI0021577898|nr:energy transducer TonB [Marinoscillum pacificum]
MSYRKNIYWIEENSYSSENQLKNFDQILKKAKQRKLRLQVIRGSIMVISLVSLFLVWRLIDPYGQTGGVNDSINELNQNKVMLGVKDSILSLNQTHSKKSLQDSGQRMDMVNGSSEVGMEKSINKEKQDNGEVQSPSAELSNNVERSKVENNISLLEQEDQQKMLKHNTIIMDSIDEVDEKPSIKPENSLDDENVKAIYTNAYPLVGFDSLYHFLYQGIDLKVSQQHLNAEELSIYFYIDSDGKPSDIQIKGVESDTVVQLIRKVVEQMPVWKPAMINDQPVRRQFMLPLKFETDDK